ncbi:MAG: nucleotidyltransferase substrate binding protein [Gammaproteobacteria bacterium]|nr:nucleotidyltransferase substrate binding protein [Gammaproteobacteria bacterium]
MRWVYSHPSLTLGNLRSEIDKKGNEMVLAKKFDVSSLVKAMNTLDEAVTKYAKVPDDKFVRDACIQRFEYTYELSHKTLRRYMALSESSIEVVEEMSFPELIRTACERGLLKSDWSIWILYREARNMTSHTYDETKAEKVVLVVPEFLKEVQSLIKILKKRMSEQS